MVIPESLYEYNLPEGWGIFSVASLLRKGVIIDLKDGNHGANHPKSVEFTDKGLPLLPPLRLVKMEKLITRVLLKFPESH